MLASQYWHIGLSVKTHIGATLIKKFSCWQLPSHTHTHTHTHTLANMHAYIHTHIHTSMHINRYCKIKCRHWLILLAHSSQSPVTIGIIILILKLGILLLAGDAWTHTRIMCTRTHAFKALLYHIMDYCSLFFNLYLYACSCSKLDGNIVYELAPTSIIQRKVMKY